MVGFIQPLNPDYAIIDAPNLLSRSGYFINDNPFVKIETIKDSQDFIDITDADFNDYLREKIKSSIVTVANEVCNGVDFIDRQVLYPNAMNKFNSIGANVYDLLAGFSCYKIKVESEKNIAFEISRAMFDFDGTGDITIYLFNSANLKTPLQTKTVTITEPFQDVTLNWVCDNSVDKGYKGDYFIGYFTDGLTLKPFKREFEQATIQSDISELCVRPLQFTNFTQLSDNFDISNPASYNPYNGLNLDITVYEDFTDLIVNNERLFARAIQLHAQINFLTETIASLRSNRNERLGTNYIGQLLLQIEGETGENNVKVKGLRPLFAGAISTLKKEIKKMQIGYFGEGQIMLQTLR